MKRSIQKFGLFLLICATLSGCGATGPKFRAAPEPPSDKALIYIYRPGAMMAGAKAPTILVNETHKFELLNKGYAQIVLPAGAVLLRIEKESTMSLLLTPGNNWTGSVFIEAEPGRTYYARFKPELLEFSAQPYGGGYNMRTRADFRQVSERIGRQEILRTKSVPIQEITDK